MHIKIWMLKFFRQLSFAVYEMNSDTYIFFKLIVMRWSTFGWPFWASSDLLRMRILGSNFKSELTNSYINLSMTELSECQKLIGLKFISSDHVTMNSRPGKACVQWKFSLDMARRFGHMSKIQLAQWKLSLDTSRTSSRLYFLWFISYHS